MDDDELSIDLSKIKKMFKKAGNMLDEDTENEVEEEIKEEIKEEKEKISEINKQEIKEEEKLERLEEEKANLETTKENITEKEEELKEIHKEEEKIVQELAQEEKKVDEIEEEVKTIIEPEEEITMNWDKQFAFLKSNKKIVIPALLIIIAIFFSTFFRMYPAELPVTDNWARQNVENYYKNQIKQQIDAQYPNLPDTNKQGLIDNEYEKVKQQEEAKLEAEIKQTSQFFKTKMQDEDGQTYLLAIDPYLWYGEARNYLEKGHFGTEIVDGKEINFLRNGREGRVMPNIKLHSLFGAWLHKIRSIYSDSSLMSTFFIIPVIIIGLSIIPAFYIGQKVGGNVGGFFSAMILALNGALLSRTPAGFSDTDPYNILFPLLMGWLFLESINAKTQKNRIILAGLAGLCAGLFSKAWLGWWYIFGFILATIVIITIYELYRSTQGKKSEVKNMITIGITYFITSGIFVTLMTGFQIFYKAFKSPFDVVFLKEVAVTTLWPNVLTTVAEFNEAPLGELIKQMGGNLLFFIAILGILLTLLIKNKQGKNDTKYAIFLTIWFIGTAYGFTKGVRFGILMVPAFAIALGAGVGIIYRYLSEFVIKDLKVPKLIGKTTILILFLLLLISPMDRANAIAKGEIPSMNDAWYESLTAIKQDSTDAITTSWWDFGHWFVAITERRVTFDGADQGERIHWVGKSLLTSDEKQAVGILRMLNCGQEKAPHVIEEILEGDTVKAIELLNEIMLLNKEEAIKRLAEEGMTTTEIAKVIKTTHCEDLIDQYYITSEDMIGKAGVWGHFGSWDFKKAKMWQTVRKQDYETGIKTLTEEFNLSEDKADSVFYDIKDKKADQWVSPWPSYMSREANCQQEEEKLFCGNGVEVNLTTMEGYVNTQQGRGKLNSLGYVNAEGEFVLKKQGGNTGISATLIPGKTTKSIVLDPKLAGSMFTRLFFLEGHGLEHFHILTDKQQVTGGKIQVWKVSWEPGEQIDTLKQEPEIRASHILISTDTRTEEEALKLAKEVKEKITSSNFAEIAKEYSEGPTGPNGGDLGFFGKGRMVPTFEKTAFELEIGEVSEPVKTQFGYHIITVTEKKGEETKPTPKKEEVKEKTDDKTKEFEITI